MEGFDFFDYTPDMDWSGWSGSDLNFDTLQPEPSMWETMGGYAADFLSNPLVQVGGLGLLSNYLGAQQNQGAMQSAVQDNRNWWQQNAFPNQAKVSAMGAQANADLASRLAESKRRYAEDAAKRGLRGGSLAGGLSALERGSMQDYGTLANQLIQFQNTPQFAPTSGTQMQATQTPMGSMYNTLGGLSGLLAGNYAYKNLFQ